MEDSGKHTARVSKPISLEEGHKVVLALIRAGALEQAEKEFYRRRFHEINGHEDIMGLSGRLLKSKALEETGDARRSIALEASERYAFAYEQTGGTYSGINTATLALIGGDETTAYALADEILRKLPERYPTPGEDAYYHMATKAEAHLLLGDAERARKVLVDAQDLDPHNYEAHATTLLQFEMILQEQSKSVSWLNPLRPPKTLHFAGHIFSTTGGIQLLEPEQVSELTATIEKIVADENIGFAYGALAAGSDIIIAEAVLAVGAELHVVLPCADGLFIKKSLEPFGPEWRPRFEACMAAAKSVRYVTADTETMDDLSTVFSSEVSMGLAALRAQTLATEAAQIVVWDHHIPISGAGTARDAILWSKNKRRQIVVPYPVARKVIPIWPHLVEEKKRGLKAMIFADVRGFGTLNEAQVPIFIEEILKPLSARVERLGHHVKHQNTWGDGLFLVLDSVDAAAELALSMQACFREIDLRTVGLPEFLALRIGGHYGPVHELDDPVMGQPGVFGTEVSFAARIEPVTVPGSIYVSEPFACSLAANTKNQYRCEYVQDIQPRRDRPPLPLFSLRRMRKR